MSGQFPDPLAAERARALDEAADELLSTGGPQDRDCGKWLRARADRERGEATTRPTGPLTCGKPRPMPDLTDTEREALAERLGIDPREIVSWPWTTASPGWYLRTETVGRIVAAREAAAVEAALAPVRALVDEWETRAGENSPAWRVYCPQTIGVPFAVGSIRAVLPPAPTEGLANACKCGDCYHPVIGPDTDGEPCDWCRDCGCPAADHTRMIRAVLPPAPTEGGDR